MSYPFRLYNRLKKLYFAANMRAWIFSIFILTASLIKGQILPSFGDSRTGTTGLQFLKIEPDARSVSLAGSFITEVNDPTAMYWNPAGLAKMKDHNLQFSAGHVSYYANTTLEHTSVAYALSEETYIGLGLVYFDSGDMPVTTEFQPFGTGQTFRATDMALGLSLARTLTDNFNFGLTARYVNESLAGVNTNAVVFDFGFQYDVGLANTRFAVSISNFGFNTTPQGELQIVDLNGTRTLSAFEQIAIPAVFRLGFAWDALNQETHRLTLIGQLDHPTDNNETLDFGTEYAWKNLLYARAGYRFGIDEGGLPAFGFGLNLKRSFGQLKVDYGFNSKNKLGSTHRLTLGLGIL